VEHAPRAGPADVPLEDGRERVPVAEPVVVRRHVLVVVARLPVAPLAVGLGLLLRLCRHVLLRRHDLFRDAAGAAAPQLLAQLDRIQAFAFHGYVGRVDALLVTRSAKPLLCGKRVEILNVAST